MKPNTPKIVNLNIPKESIDCIIGPGGKLFKKFKKKQIQLLP